MPYSLIFLLTLTLLSSCAKPQNAPCPGAEWRTNIWNPQTSSYGAWWCPPTTPTNPGGNQGGGGSSFGYDFKVGKFYILTSVGGDAGATAAAAVDFDNNCAWDGGQDEDRRWQLIPGFKFIGYAERWIDGYIQDVPVFVQDLMLVEREYMANYAVSQSYIAQPYDIPYIAVNFASGITGIGQLAGNEPVETTQVVPGGGTGQEYDYTVGFEHYGRNDTNFNCNGRGSHFKFVGQPTVVANRM